MEPAASFFGAAHSPSDRTSACILRITTRGLVDHLDTLPAQIRHFNTDEIEFTLSDRLDVGSLLALELWNATSRKGRRLWIRIIDVQDSCEGQWLFCARFLQPLTEGQVSDLIRVA
ncbi:MAG: hypothetical protein KatS3mg105_4567 [Gemmatales bacterium]|nr:MAG: hypothetical protein KatS3mg105_4567 [Gemmatales bacterium]